MSLVYCHFRETDQNPFYVGMGKKENRPFEVGSRRSEWHRRVSEKHGMRVKILIRDIDWKTAGWWEKRWIKVLKNFGYPLVNHTEGGDGVCGASIETIKKMKISSRKRWDNTSDRSRHSLLTKRGMDFPEIRQKLSCMKGKKHSKETREKMSASHIIVGKSEALKKTRSNNATGKKNPFFGKKHTEDSRKKMSDSLKGRTSPWTGKTFTDEHKEKLKAAWILRKLRQGIVLQ